MDSDLNPRVRELFAAAAERPAGERGSFLDAACGGDADVREEVWKLLDAHERAGSLLFLAGATLAPPAGRETEGECGAGRSALRPAEAEGDRVGPYRLVRRIGEGGFGDVYEAEQEWPVRRRVALKVVKLGMDTRHVVARFDTERQALALMDHPNIAKVFDAGATDAGRPYFVMELVAGPPVTDYCDAKRLDVRRRLELFVSVCRAVQHAHQKGVIHRDLKPSNILVAEADGEPIPKVIDFGIAKATHPGTGRETLTRDGRFMMGTPDYMSPEQAESDGHDVDTRSDIYSLGVLLYELLTGTTPFGFKTNDAAWYGQIQRQIVDSDPPPPSARLAALDAPASRAAAERRGMEQPAKLGRLVRGELDWVVMKCLQKDRAKRYVTAEGLASDVQRYLRHEPVVARPATVSYRARKFARRHRAAVAAMAGLLVLLAAVVGTGIGTVRAQRAREHALAEGRRAENLFQFIESLFTLPQTPAEGGASAMVAADVLDRASADIDGYLSDQPLARIRGRQAIGRSYRSIGATDAAIVNLEKCLALSREHLGRDDERTLRVAIELSEARAEQVATLPPDDTGSLVAERDASEAAVLAAGRFGPDHRLAWDAAAAHGTIKLAKGEFALAERTFQDLLLRIAVHYGVPRDAAQSGNWRPWPKGAQVPIGPLLIAIDKAGPPGRDDGERAGRWGLALARALHGDGQRGAAEDCLNDLVSGFSSGECVSSPLRSEIAHEWGRVLASGNDLKKAEWVLQRAAWELNKVHPHEYPHPLRERIAEGLASVMEERGDLPWARTKRLGHVTRLRDLKPRNPAALADALFRLAVLDYELGRGEEGGERLAEAIKRRRDFAGADDPTANGWWRVWMRLMARGGRPWKSDALQSESLHLLDEAVAHHRPPEPGAKAVKGPALTFELFRWDESLIRRLEARGTASDPLAVREALRDARVAAGRLDDLRGLEEPPPGLYVLSVQVETEPGTVRKAEWVLFEPWKLSLYNFDLDGPREQVEWERVVADGPHERRDVSCLSLEGGPVFRFLGPNQRSRRYGIVATSRLELPPGDYRLSFTADDGVRAWLAPAGLPKEGERGRPVVDAWARGGRQTPEARVRLGGAADLHVEYFQWDGGMTLRMRAEPESPAAAAAVAALEVVGLGD